MDIIEKIKEQSNRIAELEAELEQARVARAASFAAAVDPEAEVRRYPSAVGAAIGISRQNVEKAIREMGPGTARARAAARVRKVGASA